MAGERKGEKEKEEEQEGRVLSNPLIFWVVPMRSYHFHLISCITVAMGTCWSQNLQCRASAYHHEGLPSCLHVTPEGPREWLPAGREWAPPGPAHPRTLHRRPPSVGHHRGIAPLCRDPKFLPTAVATPPPSGRPMWLVRPSSLFHRPTQEGFVKSPMLSPRADGPASRDQGKRCCCSSPSWPRATEARTCRTTGVVPQSKELWIPGLALTLNTVLGESPLSPGTEMDQLWVWDLIISFKSYNSTAMHM